MRILQTRFIKKSFALIAALIIFVFAGGPIYAHAQVNAAASLPLEIEAVSTAAGSCAFIAATPPTANDLLRVPVSNDVQAFQKCADNVNAGTRTATSIWDKFRTNILNPLARTILRVIGREMKRQIINYIVTGNFGQPTFVTNFQLDAKQAAENAARSYLSQLTGINFCNFFPYPTPAVYSINVNLQFVCTINSNLYTQFLRNPLSMTEVQRILAMDPSTNYVQTVVSIGQYKAQAVAQALVARAAQTSSGFIGDTVKQIAGSDQASYQEAQGKAITETYQKVYQETYDYQIKTGASPEAADKVAQQQASEASKTAGEAVPKPLFTDKIRTPGQTLRDVTHDTFLSDVITPTLSTEFDQALLDIANTAVGVLVNKGLNTAFGH